MDYLSNSLLDFLEKWYRNKQLKGDNRYIFKDGRNIDVLEELEVHKRVIARIADEYADDARIQQLIDNLSNEQANLSSRIDDVQTVIMSIDARLTEEESNKVGIDHLARDWARTAIVREMKNRLADEAERNYEAYQSVSTRDGWYDPLNNLDGVDIEKSLNIIHQIQNGDGVIVPDTSISAGVTGAEFMPSTRKIVSDPSFLRVSHCSDSETNTLYHLKNGGSGSSPNVLNHLVVVREGVIQETITLPFNVEHSDGTVMCYVPEQNSLYFYIHRYNSAVTGFWRYDLTTRTAVNLLSTMTGTKPFTRFPSMTYHKSRRKIMIWGGLFNSRRPNLMLEYDIDTNNSVDVTSGVSQSGFVGAYQTAMFYMDHSDELILFGGTRDGYQTILDATATWRWNALTSKWEQIATTTRPTANRLGGYAYMKNFGLVAYGGATSTNSEHSQPAPEDALWFFDGVDWKRIEQRGLNADDYQKQLLRPVLGIQGIDNKLHLVVGKSERSTTRDLYFIELDIMSSECRTVFKTFDFSTDIQEVLLTAQYAGNIEFFVSVDNGLNYTPIQIDTPYTLERGESGRQLVIKAVLSPNAILAGAAVAVV